MWFCSENLPSVLSLTNNGQWQRFHCHIETLKPLFLHVGFQVRDWKRGMHACQSMQQNIAYCKSHSCRSVADLSIEREALNIYLFAGVRVWLESIQWFPKHRTRGQVAWPWAGFACRIKVCLSFFLLVSAVGLHKSGGSQKTPSNELRKLLPQLINSILGRLFWSLNFCKHCKSGGICNIGVFCRLLLSNRVGRIFSIIYCLPCIPSYSISCTKVWLLLPESTGHFHLLQLRINNLQNLPWSFLRANFQAVVCGMPL